MGQVVGHIVGQVAGQDVGQDVEQIERQKLRDKTEVQNVLKIEVHTKVFDDKIEGQN